MSNKMEVPPELAIKCTYARPSYTTSNISLIFCEILLGQGTTKYGFEAKHWAVLILVNKELHAGLVFRSFWVEYVGFSLQQFPENFSPLLLYRHFLVAQKQPSWERVLLTSAVPDGRKSNSLTPLVVSMDDTQSQAFWLQYFSQWMTLATFPTQPQSETLINTVNILIQKGKSKSDLISFVSSIKGTKNKVLNSVFAWAISASQKIPSKQEQQPGQPKPQPPPLPAEDGSKFYDGRVRPERVATVQVKQNTTPSPLSDVTIVSDQEIATLIPDFTTIFYLVALTNGLIVDNLKDEKYTLTKKNLPSSTRRAIVIALANMHWLGLCDAFKKSGLTKKIFKHIHISRVVYSKKIVDLCKDNKEFQNGISRVRLLIHVLRRSKYPKEENFPSWLKDVVEPLTELCETNPLFAIKNKLWLSKTFLPELVGKKVPKPAKRTVEGVLAQDGNTKASWNNLFKADVVTGGQILANMRNLILLDYPIEEVESQLTKKGKSLTLMQYLRIRQLILGHFSNDYISNVTKRFTDSPATEQKITLPSMTFKDKKGQYTTKTVKHIVAKSFSTAVPKYISLCDRKITSMIKSFPGKFSPELTSAVIPLSSELNNFIRSGMPPSIPNYTRTSLWRGEVICLEDIARPYEEFQEITIGMTWCQQPDQEGVDLDLSILFYDEHWNFLTHCSFSNLQISGANHSGDWTDAPYPYGARESVKIHFPTLLEAYPRCRFAVINVYSFSGNDMSALYDASGFVGNSQQAGTGPGGIDIISAAKMTGSGSLNIAGFVSIEESPYKDGDFLHFYYNVDQSINVKNRTATGSTRIVHTLTSMICNNLKLRNPPRVRLSSLAAFYSALVANEVTLIHKGGQTKLKFSDIPGDSTRFDFFKYIESKISSVTADVKPVAKLTLDEPVTGKKLYVFGGELLSADQIASDNSQFVRNSQNGNDIIMVNLRSDIKKSEVKEIPGLGPITVISGFDVSDIL